MEQHTNINPIYITQDGKPAHFKNLKNGADFYFTALLYKLTEVQRKYS